MKGVRIRRLTPKDIPQAVEILELTTKRQVPAMWRSTVEKLLRRRYFVGFCATKQRKVLGFVIGEIKGIGFGLQQSGWIVVIAVHPQHMGSGIGKALAERLLDFFRKSGINDIYTSVRWDAVDMLSFFKSIGFNRSEFINLSKHLKEEKERRN